MIAPTPLPANTQSASRDEDSDSDWDDDDDLTSKKINIVIKPIAQLTPTNISASVDELRSAVDSWKTLAGPIRVQSSYHVDAQNRANIQHPNEDLLTPVAPVAVLPMVTTSNSIAYPIEPQLTNILPIDQSRSSPVTAANQLVVPVAFAIQETLDVIPMVSGITRELCGGISLKGCVKIAVPPELMRMDVPISHQLMRFELVKSCPMATNSTTKLNQNFIRQSEKNNNSSLPCQSSHIANNHLAPTLTESRSAGEFLLDLKAAQSYIRQRFKDQSNYAKYYILPELIIYEYTAQSSTDIDCALNPLVIKTKMTCELNLTKIRIDLSLPGDSARLIAPQEIQNLSLSLLISGQIKSFQCQPEATWNPEESRLTWNFTSFAELIQLCHGRSSADSSASCMGLLELSAGPSTVSDVHTRFSVKGKSLVGANVRLDGTEGHFRLAMQTFELRTGNYRCTANQ